MGKKDEVKVEVVAGHKNEKEELTELYALMKKYKVYDLGKVENLLSRLK